MKILTIDIMIYHHQCHPKWRVIRQEQERKFDEKQQWGGKIRKKLQQKSHSHLSYTFNHLLICHHLYHHIIFITYISNTIIISQAILMFLPRQDPHWHMRKCHVSCPIIFDQWSSHHWNIISLEEMPYIMSNHIWSMIISSLKYYIFTKAGSPLEETSQQIKININITIS